MYISKCIYTLIFYSIFGLVALHVVSKGMKILQNPEDDSLLQQYVSEGPAFNQRGQQHMPHILPSLFKAGQGIFAEAASQFARRKEQDIWAAAKLLICPHPLHMAVLPKNDNLDATVGSQGVRHIP